MDLFLKKTCSFSFKLCGLLMASYTDGTHSLQMIHWWASAKSVLMKKQTHLHGWPEGEYIFSKLSFFCVNYSFKYAKWSVIELSLS